MTVIGPLLTGWLTLLGVPVAGAALYLLTLALASAFHRPRNAAAAPVSRLVVLVPAHDEVELVPRCIASLRDQRYPHERYRLVVVADNCTDQTAAVARSAGAEVLERDQPSARGKGHALRWAMGRLFAEATPPDAVVVVDADAIADPDFLREVAAKFVAGRDVVQGNDLVLVDPQSPQSALEAAALLLRNGVRFAGRAVLGMPATLCGNGMLLSRRVLQQHPWSGFTAVEDGEYSLTLRMAGVEVAFAENARVYAAATVSGAGAYTQGVRWEAGRLHLMRTWLLPMLSAIITRRRLDLLGDAVDLAVPPFGMLTVTAALGAAVSLVLVIAHVVPVLAAAPWALAVVALPVYVVVGLRAARAPFSFYLALFVAGPHFVARKFKVYLRLVKGFEMTQWIRTARPAEPRSPRATRP